jgi:hypothetical protein
MVSLAYTNREATTSLTQLAGQCSTFTADVYNEFLNKAKYYQ